MLVIKPFTSSLLLDVLTNVFNLSENFPAAIPINDVNVVVNLKLCIYYVFEYSLNPENELIPLIINLET